MNQRVNYLTLKVAFEKWEQLHTDYVGLFISWNMADFGKAGDIQVTYGDAGGASRFFIVQKHRKRKKVRRTITQLSSR